jgi:hypothetical protein
MSRNLERSIARNLYAKFAKRWRQEQRLSGVYGQPGYKRPKFNEWYAIHQKNLDMMNESTPADVREYVGADPWGEPMPAREEPKASDEGERGVTTINIAGSEDD